MTDYRQQILDAFAINLLYGRELFEATPESQFCYPPLPGMNHPAWIAGHITLPHRRVANELGAKIDTPDGWVALFARGSDSQPDPSRYPSKRQLIQAFLDGHEQLASAYRHATEGQLAAPNLRWKPNSLSTLGAIAIHAMTTHEAMRLGQLSAWRRAMGMRVLDVTG